MYWIGYIYRYNTTSRKPLFSPKGCRNIIQRGNTMKKKKTSLIQRFNTLFLVFIVAALLLSGTFSFVNLNRFYQNESKQKLFNVNKYLGEIVAADGDEFIRLKNYFIDHREEIHVPFDFNGDYREERARYQYAELLREFFEAGLRITFGSDSHNAYNDNRKGTGRGDIEIEKYLLSAGFKAGDFYTLQESDLW